MKKLIACALMLALLFPLLPARAENGPEFVNTALSDGMAGVFYATRFSVKDEKNVVFGIAYNNDGTNGLPKGMKLKENGALFGYPERAGTYVFRVCAVGQKGDTYQTFTLNVRAFNEAALNPGGKDLSVIGAPTASFTGISNALNGGRAAMAGDTAFIINRKGFLLQSEPPYKKTVKRFPATAYANMAHEGGNLYYFQRYLDKRGTAEDGSDNKYYMRVARDPLGEKGRSTLAEMRGKIASLTARSEGLVFIDGEKHGVISLLGLEGGLVPRRAYADGRAVFATHMLVMNGKAYFRSERDGRLYQMYLDGEIARPVTDEKAASFTFARYNGYPALCWTNEKKEIFFANESGQGAARLGTLKGKMLNADDTHLYFLDAQNKYRPTRVLLTAPDEKETLCDTQADSLYVFDRHIIFLKKGSSQYYILDKNAPGAKPVRLNKE